MQPRRITANDEAAYPESQKLTYTAPPGMPAVLDLETLTIDGASTSFWTLTKEELHALMEGASIELTVLSGSMPPVQLSVAMHGESI